MEAIPKIPRNISMSLPDWEKLDEAARERKTSRSDLVRKAVSQFLDGPKGVKK